MPRKAATRRVATRAAATFHPVFGPVADPGPVFGSGHFPGVDWGPWHWHGPIPDPAPPFDVGGWRTSLAALLDRQKLSEATVQQLSALRAKRVAANIAGLEQEAKFLDAEWGILSKVAPGLVFPTRIPEGPQPGDPAPEIKPVDFVRYQYEARAAELAHRIGFLKQVHAAIEGRP